MPVAPLLPLERFLVGFFDRLQAAGKLKIKDLAHYRALSPAERVRLAEEVGVPDIEQFKQLSDENQAGELHRHIATVTANPAESVGLSDRGRIEEGKRADFVRVNIKDGRPLVRGVWVAGERVG